MQVVILQAVLALEVHLLIPSTLDGDRVHVLDWRYVKPEVRVAKALHCVTHRADLVVEPRVEHVREHLTPPQGLGRKTQAQVLRRRL